MTHSVPEPDYSWAAREDWESTWQTAIDQIGHDFGEGQTVWARVPIERGAVLAYLEPLEFDCRLHDDESTARGYGYDTIVAPYSGLATWISPGVWNPGEPPIYTSADRNALPRPRPNPFPFVGPPVNAGFATDIEYEYFKPFYVGDHLGVRGPILRAVTAKQTSVGRGAFLTWETNVVDRSGVLKAKTLFGMYRYYAAST